MSMLEMTVGDFLSSAFQILIGPAAIGFLIWAYYKIQNDPKLQQPQKMSLDVLESEKPPGDWENLDDFPETEEESQDEIDENGNVVKKGGESSSDKENAPAATPAKGQPENLQKGDMKIKLGVGPQGVKGRPNQGRPDPRTMKLMLLESLRDKKNKLEEQESEMDPEMYKKQMENLERALDNANKMPTDPKQIEKDMEQKALKNARETAKQQLEAIAKARTELLRARAENRVPDHIFQMNINRMQAGENQFNKMLKADDEELIEIMKEMQQKAMQMQQMQRQRQMQMQKQQAEMAARKKAAEEEAKKELKITEIDEDAAEEINMDDHEGKNAEGSNKKNARRRNNKAE